MGRMILVLKLKVVHGSSYANIQKLQSDSHYGALYDLVGSKARYLYFMLLVRLDQ